MKIILRANTAKPSGYLSLAWSTNCPIMKWTNEYIVARKVIWSWCWSHHAFSSWSWRRGRSCSACWPGRRLGTVANGGRYGPVRYLITQAQRFRNEND